LAYLLDRLTGGPARVLDCLIGDQADLVGRLPSCPAYLVVAAAPALAVQGV
jgi:hypothetical protein